MNADFPDAVTEFDTDLVSQAVQETANIQIEKAWRQILLLLGRLTAEERHIGRPLRGHAKIGCHCRYCKAVLSNQIILLDE